MTSYLLLSLLWLMMAVAVTYIWGGLCEIGEIEEELKEQGPRANDAVLELQEFVRRSQQVQPEEVEDPLNAESDEHRIEALH